MYGAAGSMSSVVPSGVVAIVAGRLCPTEHKEAIANRKGEVNGACIVDDQMDMKIEKLR